jgi:uncharacterized membrane protein HdeD (DUF308 family)
LGKRAEAKGGNMSVDKSEKNGGVDAVNYVNKILQGNRMFGIIAAVVMILFGVLFVASPLGMAYLTEVFVMCGLIVYGVFRIVAYVRTPAEARAGWTLANGIISIVLGVIILSAPPVVVIEAFAFILGFFAISSGINLIVMSGQIKRETGTGSTWAVVSGVINLVMGVFLVISPFALTFALDFVFGVYLVVGGIALIVETLGSRPRRV